MEITIQQASVADLPLILDVQKRAFSVIAKAIGNDRIQPLRQSLRELQEENRCGIVLKFVSDGQIAGSIRAYLDSALVCHVGKLVVDPDFQRQGIGSALLAEIEAYFPTCLKFSLFTSEETPFTSRLYQKMGYQTVSKDEMGGVMMWVMEKPMSLLCRQKDFGRMDYADCHSARSERSLTVDEALSSVFRTPRWVNALLKLRDVVARPFGLKTAPAAQFSDHYVVGGKAAIFNVSDRDDREIVMSDTDSHLNFAVSVSVTDLPQGGTDVRVTTIVHFNNRLGKVYFSVIRPFHRLIVHRSVSRLAKTKNTVGTR